MPPVFLGVPRSASLDEELGPWTSCLGGHPRWLLPLSTSSRSCTICKEELHHVLQLSAVVLDLEERTLYVSTCVNGHWALLRQQLAAGEEMPKQQQQQQPLPPKPLPSPAKKDQPPPEPPTPPPTLTNWTTETTSDDLESLLQQMTTKPQSPSPAKLTKSSKPTSSKSRSSSRRHPIEILIDCIDEPTDYKGDFSHEQRLLQKYNAEAQELGEDAAVITADNDDTALDNDDGDDERPPSPTLSNTSSCSDLDLFSRISLYPSQLLRYGRGGRPLWPTMSSIDAIHSRTLKLCCEQCHGPVQFEFQLTPASLQHIQYYASTHVEWSTVAFYTCVNSCGGTCQIMENMQGIVVAEAI